MSGARSRSATSGPTAPTPAARTATRHDEAAAPDSSRPERHHPAATGRHAHRRRQRPRRARRARDHAPRSARRHLHVPADRPDRLEQRIRVDLRGRATTGLRRLIALRHRRTRRRLRRLQRPARHRRRLRLKGLHEREDALRALRQVLGTRDTRDDRARRARRARRPRARLRPLTCRRCRRAGCSGRTRWSPRSRATPGWRQDPRCRPVEPPRRRTVDVAAHQPRGRPDRPLAVRVHAERPGRGGHQLRRTLRPHRRPHVTEARLLPDLTNEEREVVLPCRSPCRPLVLSARRHLCTQNRLRPGRR
jgi:hypothetical protein